MDLLLLQHVSCRVRYVSRQSWSMQEGIVQPTIGSWADIPALGAVAEAGCALPVHQLAWIQVLLWLSSPEAAYGSSANYMAGDDLPVGNGPIQVPPTQTQNEIVSQQLAATLLLNQNAHNNYLDWLSNYALLAQHKLHKLGMTACLLL